MRIVLVCPAPRGSRLGNRVTALRWKKLIAELGHEVSITTGVPSAHSDVVIALHARHSAEAVRVFRERHPEKGIAVALTGTDLYRDILHDASAKRSLVLADVLVVLHDRASLAVPPRHRRKLRLVRQSAEPLPGPTPRAPRSRERDTFDVAFVAHLRPEKDPLRAPLATRLLAPESAVRVIHAGRALTDEAHADAVAEQEQNSRYDWLGEISPLASRKLIARSDLLVLTSVMEGGANVLGEAIVLGTPIVASRIPASVAALGPDYPALFRVGDTKALARLLRRAETDPAFLAELTKRTRARHRLFTPAAEKAAWRTVLRDVSRAARARRAAQPD